MDDIDKIIGSQLFLPLTGALTFAILWILGPARPGSLKNAPVRDTGLVPLDGLVGGFIMFGILSSVLLLVVLINQSQTQPPTPTGELISSIGMILGQFLLQGPVVAFLLIQVVRRRGFRGVRELGLIPRRPVRDIFFGLLAAIISLPMVMGATALATRIGEQFSKVEPNPLGHETLQTMTKSSDPVAFEILIAAVVVFAPLLEEPIFRGLFQNALRAALPSRPAWTSVLLSAMLFGLVHASAVTWQSLPGLIILGIILGWLYEKTGSLWPNIVTHMLFNACNVFLAMQMTAQ